MIQTLPSEEVYCSGVILRGDIVLKCHPEGAQHPKDLTDMRLIRTRSNLRE